MGRGTLYRSTTNKRIFGVAGGLGEYFNIDPIIFRIIFFLSILSGGIGVLLYLFLVIALPER